MPDTAYLAILDRSQASAHAAKHYQAQMELLRQITNYGTNLIMRAYESSEKDIAAAVTCTVLLRQVVSTFDAIQVLAEAGATHAAYLPARAAFEASVYLDWILFSDSDRKARCYLVGNYREERLWAKRAIVGTDEKKLLDQIAKRSGLDALPSRAAEEADAKAHLAEVDRILAQASLAAIDQEFETLKQKFDPEWYKLCGAKSLRQISQTVKRLMEYEIFYGKGSKITHVGSYKDHIRIGKGQIAIRQIRDLSNMRDVVIFVVVTALRSYQSVLLRYRNEELAAFKKKYTEEWRQPFLTTPAVTYAST